MRGAHHPMLMWEGPPPSRWLSQRTTQREWEGARRGGDGTGGVGEWEAH
eukprot:SAG11_NODE_22896_length_398_cov_1.187291_2_plen_48_part_01